VENPFTDNGLFHPFVGFSPASRKILYALMVLTSKAGAGGSHEVMKPARWHGFLEAHES
jgi:hypothetical protein